MPRLSPEAQIGAAIAGRAGSADPGDLEALLEPAREHGMLSLLLAAVRTWPTPPAIAATAAQERAGATALALSRAAAIRQLLSQFARERIPVLLVKGVHLEWSLYPEPGLRPRSDADLLLREEDRQRALAVLQRAGYIRAVQPGGSVAVAQFSCLAPAKTAGEPCVDVHWRVSNVHAFRDCVRWGELWRLREAVPALGPHACGPSRVHALVLACVHRVAHHRRSPRLIWLYDIHLLAGALSPGEWDDVAKLGVERGFGAVLAAGLLDAGAMFGTGAPRRVLDMLCAPAATTAEVARFVSAPPGRVGAALSDWSHLGAADRVRFVREHLFPPAAYIRERYSVSSTAGVAWMYARRVVQHLFHASR